MTTANDVLNVARAQLGTVEAPPNSNLTKFGAAYGTNGVAWCNIFTWWCFVNAGASSLTPKCAYTPATYDWYRSKGRAGTKPVPGALVFFDFPDDTVNRISHIGLVESVRSDGSIITLEGNTTSGTSGSQREGGGVYRRLRSGQAIVGYGYPAYSDVAVHATTAPALRTLRKGDKGTLVAYLQTKLRITADGDFGPKTLAAVQLFQKSRGLVVDGVVGPATWKALG